MNKKEELTARIRTILSNANTKMSEADIRLLTEELSTANETTIKDILAQTQTLHDDITTHVQMKKGLVIELEELRRELLNLKKETDADVFIYDTAKEANKTLKSDDRSQKINAKRKMVDEERMRKP